MSRSAGDRPAHVLLARGKITARARSGVVVVVGLALATAACTADATSSAREPVAVPEAVQVTGDPSVGPAFVDVRSGATTSLPERLAAFDGASHFQVSPDGSMVAFDADQRVYVAKADGTGLRRLTGGNALHRTPAWAPDGAHLVAARRDFPGSGGRPRDAVVVIDVSSGTVSEVIDVPMGVLLPSFAPDGETILFTRRGRYVFALWTVPVSGGEPTVLLRDAAFGAFSPDGSSIAFHRSGTAAWPDLAYRVDPSVWLANADGTGRRWLAGDPALIVSTIDMEWTIPRWAPDGTRIAYQDSPDPGPGPIIVAWVDGSGRRTQQLGVGTWPTWVDDTTLIVGGQGGPR